MIYKLLSNSNSTKASPPAKGLLVSALLLGFGSNAFATGIPVVDGAHIGASNLGHYGTYGQIGKQILEAKKQLEEAQRIYANVQKNLIKSSGLKDSGINMDDAFKERDSGFGMQARCPGTALSMNPRELLSAFVINTKGGLKEIKEEQQKVCQRIVFAENLQFNETVKMLNLLRKQDDKLKGIVSRREQVKDEPGPLQENTNELITYLSGAERDGQYNKAVIDAYDVYIVTLNRQQQMLTQVAMAGNASDDSLGGALTRKLVQGATLKLALDSVGNRDR